MLTHDLLSVQGNPNSPVHRLDARVKLVCALVLLVAILAAPVVHPWTLGAYAAILLAVTAASRLPVGWIAGRMLVLVPFLVLGTIALGFLPPSDAAEGWRVGNLLLSRNAMLVWLNVGGKCLLTLLAATLLTGTTTSADLVRAAGSLGMPRTLTALAGFALTYLAVLGDEAGRMITARRSRGQVRGVGRNLRVAAAMTATLMARTVGRADRIALAMVARGYRGRMPRLTVASAPSSHVAVGVLFVAMISALLWVGISA